MLSFWQVVGVVLVVAGASFVSKLSGFGFGLVVVPVMSLFLGPQDAVIISTLLGLVTTLNQAWVERAHADVALVRRLFLSACVGMPLGLLVFIFVPEKGLRIVLGVVVVAAATLLARGFQLVESSRKTELGLGFLSGVLNTSVSTNGPPLVFLLHARGYEPSEFRGTISRVFLYSNVVSIALFVSTGKVQGPAAGASLVAAPTVFVMQWLGAKVQPHVHGNRFRILVLSLLFLSGGSAVLAALR